MNKQTLKFCNRIDTKIIYTTNYYVCMYVLLSININKQEQSPQKTQNHKNGNCCNYIKLRVATSTRIYSICNK